MNTNLYQHKRSSKSNDDSLVLLSNIFDRHKGLRLLATSLTPISMEYRLILVHPTIAFPGYGVR